ncbi:UNVERIFIED_CONTAM: hypothetical protein HHA_299010 [Hammondia hammondi]|eukprot:XP_008885151.1 hypothetical protein HHA_299010 [Hammondia hammondi]
MGMVAIFTLASYFIGASTICLASVVPRSVGSPSCSPRHLNPKLHLTRYVKFTGVRAPIDVYDLMMPHPIEGAPAEAGQDDASKKPQTQPRQDDASKKPQTQPRQDDASKKPQTQAGQDDASKKPQTQAGQDDASKKPQTQTGSVNPEDGTASGGVHIPLCVSGNVFED